MDELNQGNKSDVAFVDLIHLNYLGSFWHAKELSYMKALGKVVAGILWKIREACIYAEGNE